MASNDKDSVEFLIQKLLNNSILIVLARMAGIFTLLLSVPFIIDRLGMEGYGVWEALLAVSGIAMVLQSVISSTLLWRISSSYGTHNIAETQRIVRVGVSTTISLVAVFVPVIYIFRNLLLTQLQIPQQWFAEAIWILPLIVGIVLLGGINQALAMVLTGYQRAGLSALVQSIGLITTNLTAIGLLFAGYNLSAMLLGYFAGMLLMFVVLYPLARNLCGNLSLRPAILSRQEFAILAPFVGLLLLSNLSSLLRDQTDKLILASMSSPEITGYFAMAQRLSSLLMQGHIVLVAPFTAAIGALHARQDWSGIQKLYANIGSWMAVLAGTIALLISTLHKPLFILWLGQDQPEAYSFLAFLLLGTTSAIMFSGAVTPLTKGIGHPGIETQYAIVTLILILVSKPLLISMFGPVGSVVSSAFGWLLGALFMLFLAHHKFELSREVIWRNIGIFLITLLLSTCGWILMSMVTIPTKRLWVALFLIGIGSIISISYLSILIGLRLFKLPFQFKIPRLALRNKLLRWNA